MPRQPARQAIRPSYRVLGYRPKSGQNHLHAGVLAVLEWLDWSCIALYFVLVFGVAAWATFRQRTNRGTSADYFLAGRGAGWFVVGASLFASNIGSEHLVGLAGTGAKSGVAVGQFEIMAGGCLLLLGWIFVPFYLRSGVFTMPEFLQRRYSPAARWYLAIISIVGYVLTKVSVTIAAGGIVFEWMGIYDTVKDLAPFRPLIATLHWMGITEGAECSFWIGALVVVLATGIYTILGGLRAVLHTDLLQCFVLIGGSVAVTVAGLVKLGGWGPMVQASQTGMLSLWKPISDPDFPWTGLIFGIPVIGVWYWCTDQFIVQRVLAARNQEQALKGTLFAAYLKQLPLFIFVLPGVIAAALAASGQLQLDRPDAALPALVGSLLPAGLKGLVIAGLLAALMSSLSSVFNSCSTLITWDIYKQIVPAASERSLVLVGRISTVVLVALGLLWIPLMKHISDALYIYLQNVQAYISPPVSAVFLVGICWRRANAHGAIASLAVGFVLGMAKLVLQLNQQHLSGLWHQYATINFLHFAILLFAVCTAVLVAVSLLTPPIPQNRLAGLTFATPSRRRRQPPHHAHRPPATQISLLLLTLGILAITAAAWIYFS